MKIVSPVAIEELLTARAENPAAVLLAGGTDLLAGWHSGVRVPERVISLNAVKELDFISSVPPSTGEIPAPFSARKEAIEIGATTTHRDIAMNRSIRQNLPALSEAALAIGSPAVRNMGTIGGNIVNASPAADLVPPLIIYDAILKLVSAHGTRTVPMDKFHTGYKAIDLRKDEILFSIVIPVPARNCIARYYKLGTRKAQSIAKVSLAGRIELADDTVSGMVECGTGVPPVEGAAMQPKVPLGKGGLGEVPLSKGGFRGLFSEPRLVSLIRLAAGSVAPVPLRLVNIEDMLRGEKLTETLIRLAAESLRASINPIDDVRSTAAYRRFVIGNLLRRFLMDLVEMGTT